MNISNGGAAAPRLVVYVNPCAPMPIGRRPPEFKVVEPEPSSMFSSPTLFSSSEEARARALETLEAITTGEAQFIEAVHVRIDERYPTDEAGEVKGRLNNDYLIHLAQFFFLLSAMDCTKPEQIEALIDQHNKKVHQEIIDGTFCGSLKEKRKTLFKDTRKAKIVSTIRHMGAPTFTVTEIAHLVSDFMSETTAVRLIEELRLLGAFQKVYDQRFEADETRLLFQSTGALESWYAASLLKTRQAMLGGASAAWTDGAADSKLNQRARTDMSD